MSYHCPKCNGVIYNRRRNICGYCGAELPAELLFSPAELEVLDKRAAEITAGHAKIRASLEAGELGRRDAAGRPGAFGTMKISGIRLVTYLALLTGGLVLVYFGGRWLYVVGLVLLAVPGLPYSWRGNIAGNIAGCMAIVLLLSFLTWLHLSHGARPSLGFLVASWLICLCIAIGSWRANRSSLHAT